MGNTQPMRDPTSARNLTLVAVVVAVALVVAGCGRLQPGIGQPVAGDTPAPVAAVTDPTAAAPTAAPAMTPAATPSLAPSAMVSPEPLTSPDLSGVQRLLDNVDAALGADATADTDEGSTR